MQIKQLSILLIVAWCFDLYAYDIALRLAYFPKQASVVGLGQDRRRRARKGGSINHPTRRSVEQGG